MSAKSLISGFDAIPDFSRAHTYTGGGGSTPRKNDINVRNKYINTLEGTPQGIPAGTPAKVRSTPERHIQRAILAKLAVALPLGAMVIHVPNEDATGSWKYGLSKIGDGLLPGCPDLLVLSPGRWAQGAWLATPFTGWLEVKAPQGAPNDNQLRAHPRLRAAGTPVEVVYSVGDALDACEAWGLLRAPGDASGRVA